jgi:hypothetical protein
LLEKNPTKINWDFLSSNPSAIHILEKNMDKIKWDGLSVNSSAIHLLEKNPENIFWGNLCENESGINLLRKNISKKNDFYWGSLSLNQNPDAIKLIEEHHDRFDWGRLSTNPYAIQLLKNNLNKINWFSLMRNPLAEDLIKSNMDKIDWGFFSANTSTWAIHLIEKKLVSTSPEGGLISWNALSRNPSAIHILEKNQDKIDWAQLHNNPSGIHLFKENMDKIDWLHIVRNPDIFGLDYDFLFQRMNIIRKELMEKTWHPNRFKEWCLSFNELNELT